MSDEPKTRKPRKAKPTQVELRLEAGALLLKTMCQEAERGAFWVFADTGRSARGDVVDRLITAGKLKPKGDGLFAEDSQTWGMA